jgi:hypothetical protein
MRRLVYLATLGLCLAWGMSARAEGCHGTKIEFVDTPKEAAALAKKKEKLVFVLHVSGHFEDPRYT